MLGWFSWCLWKRKEQHYVWKCVASIFGIQLLLCLELGDFPPIWWTFDAHALWHAGTAPLCLLWYRYVRNATGCSVSLNYIISFRRINCKLQSTLAISKSKGLAEYFEISEARHIRFAELRKKINQAITFYK